MNLTQILQAVRQEGTHTHTFPCPCPDEHLPQKWTPFLMLLSARLAALHLVSNRLAGIMRSDREEEEEEVESHNRSVCWLPRRCRRAET